MSKDQLIAINDAVHKIQLALLNGITTQKQLFSAGTLISQSDYEDIVTERTITKLCGYPLCRTFLPSDVLRRGKYRISLKEHKVYDVQEARKFCSADCLINSRAFAKTLQEVRTSEFDTVKLNGILCLFDDSKVDECLDVKEDLGLSKLTIRENSDVRGGEMSLEQWRGSSSAVEGYVPFDRSNCKSKICKQDSKATQNNQKKHEDPMDFTSKVIIHDECKISKLPPQTKQPSPIGNSEDGQGKKVPPTLKKSRFLRERERERKNSGYEGTSFASFGFDAMGCTENEGYSVEYSVSKQPPCSTGDPLGGQLKDGRKTMVDEMGLASSASMSDGYSVEYSVSKLPPCSMEDPLSFHGKGFETLDRKNAPLGSFSGFNTKALRREQKKLGKKVISIEYHADSCEDGGEILTAESYEGLKVHHDMCSSSETVTKSCLKVSGSKKLSRSVTWADQSDGHGDLCEVRSIGIESGLNLSPTYTEYVNSVSRRTLAEPCATEAVSSGDLDASDAAAKAGIILLPSTHQLDEEVSEEDMTGEEATLLKWPNKPGMPDSNSFDRDQSWFDEPPEGFNLTLSTFAMMWDSLFGWVSSSSLAYIYGKDESAHEEFLSVNGKEYPRRIVLGEGLSSEIKETIAGCLARTLPRVATDLRLPISISELEKGLGSLLETMSLTGAVPSFRAEQWVVIVLLFLDALSVTRIPRIAPYILNGNKVLEGSGIGNEEYETMKDILLPLGRVPQFATRSGA